MEDIIKLLNQVKIKAEKAAGRIRLLEEQNASLKTGLTEARAENEALKQQIASLQESIRVMKIAGAVSKDEHNNDSKRKIAELVREIDHCMMLLK